MAAPLCLLKKFFFFFLIIHPDILPSSASQPCCNTGAGDKVEFISDILQETSPVNAGLKLELRALTKVVLIFLL